MANSILSYLFSLIGFVPIEQQRLLRQQPKLPPPPPSSTLSSPSQQPQQYHDPQKNEEECEYLTSSTFVVEPLNEKVNNDWLFNLSKMALFKILTTAIEDYPQVANNIYTKHYNKKKDEIEELKALRLLVRSIAQSLDKQRPSEQFGRASEISFNLNQILYSAIIIEHQESMTSLFALIILAQESLNCPSEIRQHLFSNVKFGRTIVLEISKLLKNFNEYNCRDFNYKWSLISSNNDTWFDSLEYVCNKLSRYDITWEYRKEYQDVIVISKRYFK